MRESNSKHQSSLKFSIYPLINFQNMKIISTIKRIFFRLQRLLCVGLFYLDHRWYMKFYLRLLRRLGTNIQGTPRYIGVHVIFDDFRMISIGDKTTISDGSHLLTHDYSITNAFRAIGKQQTSDIAIVRPIKIGENVFIGKKAIIMPNTTIEDDCIIGAGAVVRGRIPSGSVAIGNPAIVIGTVDTLAKKWESIEPNQIKVDKH